MCRITPKREPGEVMVASWRGPCAGMPPTCPDPVEPASRKREEILAFIAARSACLDLTPGRIARQTGVSRTVLYRMLQSLGGVATVVQQQRLGMMCRGLANRDDVRSIEAIAHDSGFRSLSHATRSFHRAYGMTPGSFRRAGLVGRQVRSLSVRAEDTGWS